MKKIYLMRHGETLFNTMDVNQGQCDSPLTENGIRRLWESLPFSAVFRLLGRDLHPAALGISTFFGRFPPFG